MHKGTDPKFCKHSQGVHRTPEPELVNNEATSQLLTLHRLRARLDGPLGRGTSRHRKVTSTMEHNRHITAPSSEGIRVFAYN